MSGFEELMKKKAVALKYDAQKNGAPVIVASGMGDMAGKIPGSRHGGRGPCIRG